MKSQLDFQARVIPMAVPDPTGSLPPIALFNADGSPFTSGSGGAGEAGPPGPAGPAGPGSVTTLVCDFTTMSLADLFDIFDVYRDDGTVETSATIPIKLDADGLSYDASRVAQTLNFVNKIPAINPIQDLHFIGAAQASYGYIGVIRRYVRNDALIWVHLDANGYLEGKQKMPAESVITNKFIGSWTDNRHLRIGNGIQNDTDAVLLGVAFEDHVPNAAGHYMWNMGISSTMQYPNSHLARAPGGFRTAINGITPKIKRYRCYT